MLNTDIFLNINFDALKFTEFTSFYLHASSLSNIRITLSLVQVLSYTLKTEFTSI